MRLVRHSDVAPMPNAGDGAPAFYPIFLSVVFVGRNRSDELHNILSHATSVLSPLVGEYELIVVDNASDDQSVPVLRRLTEEGGLPNLQVYALTVEVDFDTASWVGLDNALGDFVVVVDPLLDDIEFLPEMLDKAVRGADMVFATNEQRPPQSLAYRMASATFNRLYLLFYGIHMTKQAPQYRVLSRRAVNFILQHPQPTITYRHLPAVGGFVRANLHYSSTPKIESAKYLGESLDRGVRLLVSTTRAPMRLVTFLSLFGAVANVLYSVYVVAIALLKSDVAPGWISLSLQQSGMFLLISLVLLVLGEYVLHVARLSNEGPPYHIGQEFTSARMTRREKLNVDDARADHKQSDAFG